MIGSVPPWFDPGDDRAARAAWTRLAEPDDAMVGRLLNRLGAAPALLAVFERPVELARMVAVEKSLASQERTGAPSGDDGALVPPARTAAAAERLVAGWRARLSQLDPHRDLATVRRFGGRLLIPGDPQWPDVLDDLGERAPIALWVRGEADLAGTSSAAVAIVGCRACSAYGELVAGRLGAGCAERGLAVVSGAAYGIDAAAHRGALAVQGRTLAVLACGVDRPYPRGNERLIERVAAEGSLLSEVPPGSAPTRWRFVARNRLIAALGSGTVVVEAGWRSGASITAREAMELGRPVGAVPGPVTSAASAGCHRLLRDGAVCVSDAAEIGELIGHMGDRLPEPPRVPSADHDGLDPIDLRVFDALPLRRAVTVEQLCATAGLDRATLRAAVGRLEMRGLAERSGQEWRRSRGAGAAEATRRRAEGSGTASHG